MTEPTGWVFWAGTVGFAVPVLERLEAAAALDVQRFSVTPLDVEWAAAEGIDAVELGTRIRDLGFGIVMDPVGNWYGGEAHANSTFGRFGADETLRMAEALGAVGLNLIGRRVHDATPDELAGAFAAVCDRAADFGAEAHLEFTPMTAIVDLAQGWEIVRTADRANGGLLFDTWHFARGNPDLDLLATIPGDRILSVQVADARAERLPDIRADALHRALPGDGVLDLVGMLRVLHRIGALRSVGPEVFLPDVGGATTLEVAEAADSTTRAVVAAAIEAEEEGLP